MQNIIDSLTPDVSLLDLASALSDAGHNPTFSEVATVFGFKAPNTRTSFVPEVLDCVSSNPGATVTTIVELTNLPQSAVAETLSILKERGDVVTWGAKKGTLYYTSANFLTDDVIRDEIISALVSAAAEADPKDQVVSRPTLILAIKSGGIPGARVKSVLNAMIASGDISVEGVKKSAHLVLSAALIPSANDSE